MKKSLMTVLFLASMVPAAFATTGSVSTKNVDKKAVEKKKEDPGINNAKIRAEMGSMSDFSFSTDLVYAGASISDPANKDRPNPNNKPNDYSTYITGDVMMRYRIDKSSSATVGTGVKFSQPFHGISKTDVNDATFGYSKVFSSGDHIHRFSLTGIWYTDDSVTELGNYMQVYPSYLYMRSNIGGTSFSAGVAGYYIQNFFDRDFRADDGSDRSQVLLAPMAEYKFNDTFNLRTVVGQYWTNYREEENKTKYVKEKLYQTLGLGTSFTPEIFLYTYTKFYPKESFSANANLNFALSLSLF